MIKIRKAQDRGANKISWLESYHTFSFGRYHDPEHMGFSDLRVINDDIIAESGGFAEHGHDNMEIITYAVSGSLEHRDSLGNGDVIKPGEVQVMSAGSGIRHSEFNPSSDEKARILQIWIMPDQRDVTPRYDQKEFTDRHGKLRLIASKDAVDGSLMIHQDAKIYASILKAEEEASYTLQDGRSAWVQIATGTMKVNGVSLQAGDGAAITDESALTFETDDAVDFLLFDLRA